MACEVVRKIVFSMSEIDYSLWISGGAFALSALAFYEKVYKSRANIKIDLIDPIDKRVLVQKYVDRDIKSSFQFY